MRRVEQVAAHDGEPAQDDEARAEAHPGHGPALGGAPAQRHPHPCGEQGAASTKRPANPAAPLATNGPITSTATADSTTTATAAARAKGRGSGAGRCGAGGPRRPGPAPPWSRGCAGQLPEGDGEPARHPERLLARQHGAHRVVEQPEHGHRDVVGDVVAQVVGPQRLLAEHAQQRQAEARQRDDRADELVAHRAGVGQQAVLGEAVGDRAGEVRASTSGNRMRESYPRSSDRVRSVDLSRVQRGEWIAIGGGVLLAIGIFLGWYHLENGNATPRRHARARDALGLRRPSDPALAAAGRRRRAA